MGHSFVSVIACGGESRRFGSDKSQQDLAGVSLLDRVVDIANGYGAPVALSLRTQDQVSRSDLPQFFDDQTDIGPVSALLSAFGFAGAQDASHVLLLACDQPFLPSDLAVRLLAKIGTAGVAIPVSGGHDQNMAALWRVDEAALRDYVAGGGRSLWRFAEQVGIRRVAWDEQDGDPFMDIDERAHLLEAERRIARLPRPDRDIEGFA